MKFRKKPPTKEGMFWAYLDGPKPSVEVGTVFRASNGFVRIVAGAFDFDWEDWLYWGDEIEIPKVELD